MINLLILSLSLLFVFTNYYAWLALFLSLSFLRLSYHRSFYIFAISFGCSFLAYYIAYLLPYFNHLTPDFLNKYPFVYVVIIQSFVGFVSIFYSIKNKLWKKDIVFSFMEPILIIFLIVYQFLGGGYFAMFDRIQNWIFLYIFVQILLITIKLIAIAKISEIADTFQDKLKLILKCIPYVNPSFGYNELELAGVLRFKNSTKADIIERELKYLKGKIVNEMQNHDLYSEGIYSSQLKNDQKPSATYVGKKNTDD